MESKKVIPVELLCPTEWKEPLGKSWQKVLDYIIVHESPESYITQFREIPEALDSHIQYGSQKSALQRKMKNFLSKMTDEQKNFLERMGLKLEVE